MDGPTYKLDELARAAGTSARTVRYYVQRGLLPAPAFRGKDTAYSHDHLVRLKAIRRLQEAFYPLDAIAIELARRSTEELEHLAVTKDGEPTVTKDGAETSGSGERQSEGGAPSFGGVPVARAYLRVELMPGLELAVAADAPEVAQTAAEQIISSFMHKDKKGSVEP
jgi:Ca-activated chloride channel family protein